MRWCGQKRPACRIRKTYNNTGRKNGCVRIEARGKGGHVAGPQGSVNAIGLVVGYLLDNGLCTPQEERALRMLHAARGYRRQCAGRSGPRRCIRPSHVWADGTS